MDFKRLLEKMNKFAGEPEQKPGDQVRGTEKATKKKSGEHPFKGRLVGGESRDNFLQELEVELKENALKHELVNELEFFKATTPTKPARRVTSYIDPNRTIPYPDLRAGTGGEGEEDKTYKKAGSSYILHREGEVYQLTLNGKLVKTFTAPARDIHDYLTKSGFVLQAIPVKPKANPNWFREGDENPTDTVSMDVPLLIRIMEYAKEDAKDDMDLHRVAEKLVSMSNQGRTLSMDDYDNVIGNDIETEDVQPAVPTAGGPAGATQPNPQAAKVTDPAQAALLKQQQAKLQQNLANLKTAGVDIDPAKAAQTLQKTDTGAPMNAVDKDTISKLAPAIGNVMTNPSTATQLNTLIKKAGGGQ